MQGEDADLLTRLRAGDEEAFAALVQQHHAAMVRLAATFVPSRVAEEVVQDTWLGFLRSLDRFEGRASVRTWLFRILVNRARTTGVREHRSIPADLEEPAVDPARFGPKGQWIDPPVPWTEQVEDRMVAAGLTERLRTLIDHLPPLQRQVLILRDVQGLSSQEVCDVLEISEGNQRVLLHRARSRLRGILADQVGKG